MWKEYKFNHIGINIILGSKKSNNDESNGAGKTSMIESIRYLLGAKVPKDFQNRKKLTESNLMFILEVISDSKSIFLCRVLNEQNKGYIKYDGELNFNLDNWGKPLGDKQYKDEVEKIVLGDNNIEIHPTFASIREYVLRDEKSGFNDIVLPNRKAIISYEILNYLFNIECKGEHDILKLKKKQDNFENKLKIINTLSGDISEIKIREKKLEEELIDLIDISKTVNVNENILLSKEDYKNIKNEYNKISSKIIKLESIKEQYELNINNLKDAVDKIKELDDVEKFYKQMLEYFPDKISKNYNEVLDYYKFMVSSRGKYFGEKMDEINFMVETLESRKIKLSKKMDKQLKTLQNTTVVQDISSIIDRISEKNQELADIKVRLEQYQEKDNITKKINDIKKQIIKETTIKNDIFNSYKATTDEIEKQFNEIVKITYGEGGILQFEFNGNTNTKDPTGRIKVLCSIIDENSHGRMYMKINMLDLTWLIQQIKMKSNLSFLFHDGSYVKPDNKKAKVRLLKYVDNTMNKLKMGQYFVTLNVDELEQEDIEYFQKNKKVIAFLSKEKNEDRFMGIKYV